MKALRLSEVLLPLLAARGWAPWLIAPHHSSEWPAPPPSAFGSARAANDRNRSPLRTPFDDVQ
jgi:hypothetical protein